MRSGSTGAIVQKLQTEKPIPFNNELTEKALIEMLKKHHLPEPSEERDISMSDGQLAAFLTDVAKLEEIPCFMMFNYIRFRDNRQKEKANVETKSAETKPEISKPLMHRIHEYLTNKTNKTKIEERMAHLAATVRNAHLFQQNSYSKFTLQSHQLQFLCDFLDTDDAGRAKILEFQKRHAENAPRITADLRGKYSILFQQHPNYSRVCPYDFDMPFVDRTLGQQQAFIVELTKLDTFNRQQILQKQADKDRTNITILIDFLVNNEGLNQRLIEEILSFQEQLNLQISAPTSAMAKLGRTLASSLLVADEEVDPTALMMANIVIDDVPSPSPSCSTPSMRRGSGN